MLVVVGLVFFHSARIFDTGDFYVKNEPTSDLVSIVVSFVALWGMPLLFVIAGMGIWFSLRSRTTPAFASERVGRLLVPLAFGVLVIVTPQVWTRLRGDPGYDESYWQFLPRFFDVELSLGDFPFVIGADPDTGLFEPAHLWFVVVLFAFYVVQWSTSAALKYLAISLISMVIILGIYDVAVRRTRPTRFLFGMKPPPT